MTGGSLPGGRVETLRLVETARDGASGPMPPDDGTWWSRYSSSLDGLSEDARAVVAADSRFIVERAIPIKRGSPDPTAWPEERVRTGIIVGSVQSGKTASLLGVAALALDRGVEIVVVLAGTRVALWLQSYERLLTQLDRTNLSTSWKRASVRVLVPDPYDVLGGEERAAPTRYLGYRKTSMRNALQQGKPVVIVVPKEDDHLLALSRVLAQMPSPAELDKRDRPLCMLVLDDEADDASILDAKDGSKITPQLIAALWSGRPGTVATRHIKLLATYIAYTATPQASYLQASHNPLSPRHFHATLRVPADRGKLIPRSLTYAERRGLRSFYCGGALFYELLRGLPGDLCVPYPFPPRLLGETDTIYEERFRHVRWQMIGDSMRAYFVAAALRLHEQRRRLSDVANDEPWTLEELTALLPEPCTMLYHPSALRELHFQGAKDLVRWSRSIPGTEEETDVPLDTTGEPVLALDPQGLARRLVVEEAEWRLWIARYQASVTALAVFPGATFSSPTTVSWETIRDLLRDEVFPHTRLRVLNSDARADERPGFAPVPIPDKPGRYLAPRDVHTIFIAGNVLSRGLTVEGLCTSVFLRSSKEPAADTQMQMQRWLGYRGAYIPFCRVLLFDDQLALFRAYHANDEALKQEVLVHMERGDAPFADGVLVLQGERFVATTKVDSRRVPLHPGPSPAIRLIEPGPSDDYNHNIGLVADLISTGSWDDVEQPTGTKRGCIRTHPLDLIEVASLLERLRYGAHAPDPSDELSQRWVHLQQLLGLSEPLFRPPLRQPRPRVVDPEGCPYSIAAYLRLWAAVLERHNAPGLYPTDAPHTPWSLIDLAAYRRDRPKFYLGIRFGDAGDALDPRLSKVKAMTRKVSPSRPYLLETLWGTRGHGGTYVGDQLFDYCFHSFRPVPRLHEESLWRPRGHPGLVLLHVVRHEKFQPVQSDVIAVGLALPHGGPDHIAALRGQRRP